MGLPQPRLPPPALPAGPAAAGCRPELRGQVRAGQGMGRGRPVRAGRGCGTGLVWRWVVRVLCGQE